MSGNANSGRRPVPAHILKLEGKTPRNPRAKIPPPPEKPKLRKPAGLTPAQTRLWNTLTKNRREWLANEDRAALELLLADYQMMLTAQKEASADPLRKPARVAYIAYRKAFIDLAAKFGLTPSDRARFAPDDDQNSERDDAARFLA